MSKPEGTLDQIAEYLILGYFRDVTGPNATSTKWSDSEIRVDFSRLDAKGQFLARTALDMWSSATGLAFREVSIDRDDGRSDNDRGILFQYGPATKATWLQSGSEGWISWNIELLKSTQSNAVGTKESGEYTVIGPRALYHFIHEIGHALGLGHPGNYNGSVSYQGDAKFANDSVQISAMSYFGPTENPTLKASLARPATPMSADILAIEKLYGDSNAMRTGDTVYGFNSTAGGFLDDLAGHMNAGKIFSFTLIDDGGNDSFDYSGASQGSRVDFNPGAVSDVFGRKGNMVIYKDTVIEHFIGGGGTDNVTGNDANNMLFGGAGDDTLDGGAGDDILIGGIGADTLTGGGGSDTFRYTSGTFGADTIADFEDGSDIIDLGAAGLQFTDLTISNRALDKIIDAGSGNTITLTGQAGATIDATDFSFTGGTLQVSIEDASIAEGGVASFVLRLSELSHKAVSVDWRTQDGTAVAGGDFTGVSAWRTVTFAPGQLAKRIAVQTFNDDVSEPNETFSIQLGNPVGATISDDTGNAVIVENENPTVSISDGTGSEGGFVRFQVSLDKISQADVTVNVAVDNDSAEEGAENHVDFKLPAESDITIPAGQRSAEFKVQTFYDKHVEPDETFSVRLHSPDDAYPLNRSAATGTIQNVDASQLPTPPGISLADVSVMESDGVVRVPIHFDRLVEPGERITFRMRLLDGSAESARDFWHMGSAQATELKVVEGNGTDRAFVSHRLVNDEYPEGNEQFVLEIFNVDGAFLADGTSSITILDDDAPRIQPYVAISTNPSATEGDHAVFMLRLGHRMPQDVTVNWSLGGSGSATGGEDYDNNPASGTVTIPAGKRTAPVIVETYADNETEGTETFSFSLTSASGALLHPALHHRQAEIHDDGIFHPGISISDVTVTEGGTAHLFVTLRHPSQGVVIDWSTSDGTASQGDDYVAVSEGQVIIPTFQTSARIVIATNADNLLEGSETFTVTLSNPRGRGALKDATATVTIVDGPTPPQLSIDDVTVAEGGEARFTVSLERTSAEDVTFTWATSDGAAKDGSDYTGQSGQTATIPAGRYSANVTVQTINDGEGERDETFTVELSSPVNATLGDANGKATITDNDDAPDNKYAALIATLKGYASETHYGQDHVDRWMEALAGLGEDNGYDPMTVAEANVMAGTYSASRWNPVLEALRDIEAERAAERTANTLPVASIDDVTVTEGGQAQFTVNLDKTWSDDVTMIWNTSDGTATDGSDYTGQSGQPLTIVAGQQSATFNVQTTGDSLDEDDESFTVTLSSPTNATLGDDTGEATITDDDAAPALSIDDVTVTEGGVAQFTVELDAVSGKDVTVNWATSDGTATASSDYTPQASQSVTIAAGRQSATVSVQTTDDGDDESNETFTVELSGAANATVSDATGEATIVDNDDPPSDNKYATLIATLEGYAAETQHGDAHVTRWKQALAGLGVDNGYHPMTADEAGDMADTYTASRWNPVVEALKEIEKAREAEQTANTPPVVSIDDVTVTEGGQAQFTVSLDKTWSDDVTLTWDTSDGSATDGADYTGQSNQTISITAGRQSATFNVQTSGDNLDEDDETFTVTLSSPTNATLGDDTGEATIIDDDAAPALSIEDVTVTEGGVARFTVELDAVSGKDVSFSWGTSDGTATASSDYTPQASQSVTIAAGQQNATLSVQTTDDGDGEANETFTVELSDVANATIADASGVATITDNDNAPPPPPPPVLPVASINDVTVTEGGQAQFTVNLDKTWTSDVTLTWNTSDGTATDGSDYTGQSGQTLTIAAGQQSATLAVQTTDDSDDENDETFTVTLSNPTDATLGDDTGEATIEDNDDAPDPDPDQWDHNGLTLIGTNAYDYLAGANDNDLIDGRGGPDWIDAGFGDDRMTGGKGADSFVISSNRGHDVITDFSPDEGDTVILAGPNFPSFGHMLENHVEQDGDDVIIYTSPDREAHSLTLLDTQLSALDAAQFMIIGGYGSSAVTSAHFQASAFAGRHEPLYLQINESPVAAEDADFAAHSLAVFHPAESQGDLIW